MTHDYHLSKNVAVFGEEFLLPLYQSIFKGEALRNKDKFLQKAGVDVIIKKGSKEIHIEEKIRQKYYPDILLEYLSNKEKLIKGWIEKELSTDWLSYVCIQNKKVSLFPWPLLQLAWQRNRETWKSIYRIVEAYNYDGNHGYTTVSVAVPRSVIEKEITKGFVKCP